MQRSRLFGRCGHSLRCGGLWAHHRSRQFQAGPAWRKDAILKTLRILFVLAVLATAGELFAKQPVLVISIDGMDQRYLSERDKLGLKIPNLKRLIREGQSSAGVIGVVPTVTWPSHTTMITGLDPAEHGILNNRRPAAEGGDYYWSVDLLK